MCRYQLRRCVESCAAAIFSLEPALLPWPDVLAMLQLPPGLRESGVFAAVAAHAHAAVFTALGRLAAAWMDARARCRLLMLPAHALLALLARDDLEVVSENTVYTAVASWISTHAK